MAEKGPALRCDVTVADGETPSGSTLYALALDSPLESVRAMLDGLPSPLLRTYTQLCELHDALQRQACVLPPKPPKLLIGSKSEATLEARRRAFSQMLNTLASTPRVACCPALMLFLRSPAAASRYLETPTLTARSFLRQNVSSGGALTPWLDAGWRFADVKAHYVLKGGSGQLHVLTVAPLHSDGDAALSGDDAASLVALLANVKHPFLWPTAVAS